MSAGDGLRFTGFWLCVVFKKCFSPKQKFEVALNDLFHQTNNSRVFLIVYILVLQIFHLYSAQIGLCSSWYVRLTRGFDSKLCMGVYKPKHMEDTTFMMINLCGCNFFIYLNLGLNNDILSTTNCFKCRVW